MRTGALLVVYWIGPKNIAEQALTRRLLESLQVFQVIDGLQLGGKASVKGQKLIVNEACNRKRIEALHK
jgi:hypothetical protein